MTAWTTENLKTTIHQQDADDLFMDLYSVAGSYDLGLKRLAKLISQCDFPPTQLFSAPGRTELGGNHTDHNHGKVLCAAVQNDSLAVVAPRDDGKISLNSVGFSESFEVDVSNLDVQSKESGTTQALIRGVLAGIDKRGGTVGGFNAFVDSNVGIGMGLSSSASFEVLVGTIINGLYNENSLSQQSLAQIGQFAENVYFGKPCGLMDQAASAMGGVLMIDFAETEKLVTTQVEYDFNQTDYILAVVHTDSDHADLTDAYASIPVEMKAVAHEMNADVLRNTDPNDFYQQLSLLRDKLGDRSILRAIHYYGENRRVDQMVATLEAGDFEAFLDNIAASGQSSQNLLQNVIPPDNDGSNQGLAIALGLSSAFIEEKGRGVARVHGGGFAGTIQVYIHRDDFEEYQALMKRVNGSNSVEPLRIRKTGASHILDLI